ncbi:MAG: DUF3067 family protein [Oscillatoriales cyanobacterium]|nr:MAG: DUF3067 family protein [Oscillatoriales cyanobacterium]
MTGQDLHQWIVDKWGFSYDVQVRKIKDKIFVQVMWRYLEQVSFPLTEAEYFEHLSTVATYIQGWGAVEQVRSFIDTTKNRPRQGKAVSIPIELGDRASEWLLDLP